MPQWLIDYFAPFAEAPLWLWAVAITLMLAIWFIPSFIAIFRNRPSLRAIALLNVPGGLSWIVWTALIVWAASGKGPPPDIATNARRAWIWMGITAAVLIAAIAWYVFTQGTA